MSNHNYSSTISQTEKYKQMLQDAAEMSPYIPDELRNELEACLDDDVRMLVLELQIIAIQYGRALERRDQSKAPVVIPTSDQGRLHKTSQLISKLISRTGSPLSASKQIETPKPEKSLDLLVVPGQHLPRIA